MANGSFEYIIKLLLDGADSAVDGVRRIDDSLGDVSLAASKASSSINAGLGRINLAATIQNIQSVSAALASISDTPLSFEQSAADLSSITGIVGKDLQELKQTARAFGLEAGIGAKAAADSYAVLASQIQVDQIGMQGLQTLQKETITLSQAAGMELADAATALAGTINQFGLEATESNRVINVLAAGSKYGAAEITELSQSFKVTGAVAAGAKVSLEETAGALEVLSKNNLKGAEAGTALRNIILKLQTQLGVDLGETGLSAALSALQPKLEDVTFLSKVFGMENVAAAQFLIRNASAVEEMTEKVTGTNVAYEQAEIRTGTWAHKMEVAKAKIDDLKISIAEHTGSLLPYASLLSSQAVTLSQLLPLFSSLKKAVSSAIPAIVQMTSVQGGLNVALRANPVGLIVTGIVALGAACVAAYNHIDEFREGIDSAWAVLKKLYSIVKDALQPALEVLIPLFKRIAEFVFGVLIKAFEIVGKVIKAVAKAIDDMIEPADRQAAALRKSATAAKDSAGDFDAYAIASGRAVSSIDGSIHVVARHTDTLKKQGAEAKKAGTAVIDFASQHKKATKSINTDLETIGGVQDKITVLQKSLLAAHEEERIKIGRQIASLERKKQKMLEIIELEQYQAIEGNKRVARDGKAVDTVRLPGELKPISIPVKWSFNLEKETAMLTRYADHITAKLKAALKDPFGDIRSGIAGTAEMMRGLSRLVGDDAAAWLEWGANLISAIGAALPSLAALFAASSKVAAAEGGKAVAGIPVTGPAMAVAAIASIVAALAAIPFAEGGVVSGPTYALVGEYAGARNNPEVIAPLDKLKSMLRTDDAGVAEVEFVIKGDKLVGILNKAKRRRKYT